MAEYINKDGKLVVINGGASTASTTKKVEIDPEIQRQIMAQVVDYKFGAQPEYTKPATYVLAANGSFCVKKTPFGTITVPVKEIPYMTKVEPGFKLDLPKVPYVFFLQAYSFFKDVCTKSKDEAALVLYWNKEEERYEYLCPEQTVSGAAVRFAACPEYLRRMQDTNFVRVCELHSHNTMSAFHSGTDDNDEIFDCSFLVFGKLDTAKPEHIFSYAASGVRVDSKLWDVFERPVRKLDLGSGIVIDELIEEPLFAQVTYPAEWHEQLSKYVYTAKSYAGGGASWGQGHSWYDDEFDIDGYYNGGYSANSGYTTGYSKPEPQKSAWEKGKEIKGEIIDDEEDMDKEVASKLTSKDMLSSKDYLDELHPSLMAEEVIYELESLYGSRFLDDIVDEAVKKGYGTAWWEDAAK